MYVVFLSCIMSVCSLTPFMRQCDSSLWYENTHTIQTYVLWGETIRFIWKLRQEVHHFPLMWDWMSYFSAVSVSAAGEQWDDRLHLNWCEFFRKFKWVLLLWYTSTPLQKSCNIPSREIWKSLYLCVLTILYIIIDKLIFQLQHWDAADNFNVILH